MCVCRVQLDSDRLAHGLMQSVVNATATPNISNKMNFIHFVLVFISKNGSAWKNTLRHSTLKSKCAGYNTNVVSTMKRRSGNSQTMESAYTRTSVPHQNHPYTHFLPLPDISTRINCTYFVDSISFQFYENWKCWSRCENANNENCSGYNHITAKFIDCNLLSART